MKYIPCTLCGSTRSKKLLTSYDKYLRVDKTRFTLVRCAECGLVYLNPQPTMEELAKYYPSHYPSYLPYYDVLERNRLYEVIKKIKRLLRRGSDIKEALPKRKSVDTKTRLKVLDFGCGSGRFLLSLKEAHPLWNLYGFDIGANKEIRNIDSDITIVIDVPNSLFVHFEKESFDHIYLNNVLEHVNDPVSVLRNLATLLKLSGEMTIEVPNIDSIKFKLFRSNFFPLEIPRHLYHFSPKTLGALCAKCGLSVVNIKCTGSAKGTLRSVYYALGIHKDKLDPIALFIVDKITKLVGERRINDDLMIAHIKKICEEA